MMKTDISALKHVMAVPRAWIAARTYSTQLVYIPYIDSIGRAGEMIGRRLTSTLAKCLSQTPVVALLGSRQVGKTTLARNLDAGKPSHYLDLERPSDVAKLADPELYLGRFSDHLVILDEIQRFPKKRFI